MRDYEGLYHFLYDAIANVLDIMRYQDYITAEYMLRSALQEADAHYLLHLPVEPPVPLGPLTKGAVSEAD